jgi:hypothetical protein
MAIADRLRVVVKGKENQTRLRWVVSIAASTRAQRSAGGNCIIAFQSNRVACGSVEAHDIVKPTYARTFSKRSAISFLSLTAVHLWVNWPWLRALLARLRWPTLVVTITGLIILAAFLLAPTR